MAYNLIPFSEQAQEALQQKLTKTRMFPNASVFIDSYNSGLLNTSTGIIQELAETVDKAYRNVNLINKRFIVRSQEEVAFDSAIEMLTDWKLLSALKRLSITLLDEGYTPDTLLVFTKDKPGVLHLETLSDDEENPLELYWQKEKLFNSINDLVNNMFLKPVLKSYDNAKDAIYLELENVIDIDDTFILDIEKLILENTFNNQA